MPHNLLQPAQVPPRESPVRPVPTIEPGSPVRSDRCTQSIRPTRIYQQDASGGSSARLNGHRQQRARPKFLARRVWRRGKPAKYLSATPVPSESGSCAFVEFPAERTLERIRQKRIRARKRQRFRPAQLPIVGVNLPDEQPLQFFVANCQAGLLAFERQRNFAQRLTHRLRQSPVKLQQPRNFFQKLLPLQ